MPPVSSTTSCPRLTNTSALASSSIPAGPAKLYPVKKRSFVSPVYSAQADDQQHEHDAGQVVAR